MCFCMECFKPGLDIRLPMWEVIVHMVNIDTVASVGLEPNIATR